MRLGAQDADHKARRFLEVIDAVRVAGAVFGRQPLNDALPLALHRMREKRAGLWVRATRESIGSVASRALLTALATDPGQASFAAKRPPCPASRLRRPGLSG